MGAEGARSVSKQGEETSKGRFRESSLSGREARNREKESGGSASDGNTGLLLGASMRTRMRWAVSFMGDGLDVLQLTLVVHELGKRASSSPAAAQWHMSVCTTPSPDAVGDDVE